MWKQEPADLKSHPDLRLTVLVPAHDEETTIGETLKSLWKQTRPPDHIVVVCDNCTDRTEEIAVEAGAEVFITVDNTHKKAGGLNQALADRLPRMDSHDTVMVMDADTVIVPDFVSVAMERLESDRVDAVGGIFFGEGGSGLVGALQRNEYVRYSRDISRHKGRVFVLTGTASIFRADLMKQISQRRGTAFPGTPGQVYDTMSLTEDNELTLACKTLGARMISPMQCRTVTEVMPGWGDLWRQRMRWQRGAVENITAYGVTRATFKYWGQQIGLGYGTLALNLYLFIMLVALFAERMNLAPIWLAIGMIFVVERVVTVWRGGAGARWLAAPLVLELGYDLFQQAVYAKSLMDILRRREATWNHVDRSHEGEGESTPIHKSKAVIWIGLILVLLLLLIPLHLAALTIVFSPPFQIIVILVGINTLVYAALSIGKITPKRKA